VKYNDASCMQAPKLDTAAGARLVCFTYLHNARHTWNWVRSEHSTVAVWSGDQVQVVLQAACTQARLQTCSPATWDSRSLGREDCLSIGRAPEAAKLHFRVPLPLSDPDLVAEGLLRSAALLSALDRRQGEAGTQTLVGLKCMLSTLTVLLSKRRYGNLSTVFS
jgi:hypothetical protein